MYCPKDFKPCCDDMCRGSGRCFVTGEALVSKCSGCGHFVSDDREIDDCTCDPADYCNEPVGSCDECGCNYYEEEDDGSGLCDQCQWRAAGGPNP